MQENTDTSFIFARFCILCIAPAYNDVKTGDKRFSRFLFSFNRVLYSCWCLCFALVLGDWHWMSWRNACCCKHRVYHNKWFHIIIETQTRIGESHSRGSKCFFVFNRQYLAQHLFWEIKWTRIGIVNKILSLISHNILLYQ
jgi:hypothetical protein